ncbi:hypothetical protein LIER_34013 [Lithospermum erythrorhizon]|uniref:Reverse transcriptase domain-containing protein n=1 Tax=Lithospermum erythrorhizon TaxID=34254 RepID=A0AAV3S1L4_LITER
MIQNLERKVRGGNVILKMDTAKAFNRISWGFIREVHAAFGVNVSFVDLISTSEKKSWHWATWEKMCYPYQEGGLMGSIFILCKLKLLILVNGKVY